MSIHPTVTIEDGASIADGVTIGPFCFIGKDVSISSGSSIEANVILKGRLDIKENVKIFSYATIGNTNSNIVVGKNTHIREFTQIGTHDELNRAINIGNENFIMAYVQIFDGVSLGDNCVITNAVRLMSGVVCEERVILGGLSTIEEDVTIGSGVMVGGASVVDKDIPPFMLVEGNKATIKGLNAIGLRRRLENKKDIEDIKSVFKKILGKKADKVLADEIAKANPNELVKRLASFVASANL
ncbi:MAG: acyl-ACP--UDP-N- acetylglucosamine O-acyltransferase [Sulfurimonadaceae bacterium]|jgi:UDP-N-acetylglucosamine acyltransferase|nr:acyl-ACP--UDP-N- acetylglucosamine O-acyltransferase [Sulfurimonadaceae bacterium]